MNFKTAFQILRRRVFPTAHEKVLARWSADEGDARLRQEYDLGPDSYVLDLGGFSGHWASDIFARYCCQLVIFEPVQAHASALGRRFGRNSRIRIVPVGLGGRTRTARISVAGANSSILKESPASEEIQIVDVADWFAEEGVQSVDLMKVNIEGAEYELLERLLETNLARSIANLQVQFHEIDASSAAHMERIQDRLSRTHDLTYSYRFVWENWRRRSG